MLRELRIRNLAVVEEARIEPGPGLNVISGETGAGKSILMGAIELLFGGRGDADILRAGADQARVEGLFHFESPDFFMRRGLDLPLPGGELLIARDVQRTGRSRALVNDEMATVGRLRALGEAMADLHGQHDHQRLLRPETHVDYLDRFAAMASGSGGTPLDAWRVARERCLDARIRLAALRRRLERLDERRAELAAACQEIERAAIRPGEEEELRHERQVIQHSEKLLAAAAGSIEDLEEGDGAVEERVGAAVRRLGQAAQLDATIEPVVHQLEGALVEIQEAVRGLVHYRDGLQFEPDRAEWIEERLTLLGRLKKKYGAGEAEILAAGAAARVELNGLSDEAAGLPACESAVSAAEGEARQAGLALRSWREGAAARLIRGVGQEFAALGMKEARLHVRQEPVADDDGLDMDGRRLALGERGLDRVEFFLAANPGEEARPLARVASGGELSRVMLALKAVLQSADPLPILVFDEVDAGIGGRVASEVGLRLKEISTGRQVLVITHLPMIACHADHHFRVEKRVQKGRTVTTVERLDAREREEELARMLAGADGGEAARQAARALLDSARRGAR